VVAYIERYAADNEIEVRFGTRVERIDRDDGSWLLRTSAGGHGGRAGGRGHRLRAPR
jgi:cation diffusion facilitator CzcD-associated flavoprotein CzcO